MRLMNNTYLNFEKINTDIGRMENITTLNILPDIPEKFFTKDYILLKKIEDDVLLEAISFELYKNTNYWDILMVLNGMRSMNELPVNYDIVLLKVERELKGWLEQANLIYSFLSDEQVNIKYEEILKEEIEKNEKYRNFKYISPTDLSELLADLDSKKDTIKINPNLIIKE